MDLLKSLIFEWQNAVFVAPIVFWLIYLFCSLDSLGHETDADLTHEHDFEHDHDVDQGDGGHEVQDHSSDVSSGMFKSALSFLGIGRCPMSIVLMTFGISWGFIGLVSNQIFTKLYLPSPIYFWFSVVAATILGSLFTRTISFRVAKWLPKNETTAVGLDSLVGNRGFASVPIDTSYGRARVQDKYGDYHNIDCRISREFSEEIQAGEEIIVLQYLFSDKTFIVGRKPTLPINTN